MCLFQELDQTWPSGEHDVLSWYNNGWSLVMEQWEPNPFMFSHSDLKTPHMHFFCVFFGVATRGSSVSLSVVSHSFFINRQSWFDSVLFFFHSFIHSFFISFSLSFFFFSVLLTFFSSLFLIFFLHSFLSYSIVFILLSFSLLTTSPYLPSILPSFCSLTPFTCLFSLFLSLYTLDSSLCFFLCHWVVDEKTLITDDWLDMHTTEWRRWRELR